MIRRSSVVLVLAVALASGCTTYSWVPVNLVELRDQGRLGVEISTDKPGTPSLGRVRGSARTWLFGNCEDAAQRAITALAEQARGRGSSRVTQFRFRSKWKWGREPVCQRNLTYALFVLPVLFPFPTSVTVSGVAE